jgi:hypothetical protein
MLKAEAIELLGGTVAAASAAIGVTYQAVDKWPDVLPQRIADRVHAALWRKANGPPAPAIEQEAPAAEPVKRGADKATAEAMRDRQQATIDRIVRPTSRIVSGDHPNREWR